MMPQRVTQALIYSELMQIKKTIEDHTKLDNDNFQELKGYLEGTPSVPGIRIKLDRLEQTDGAKRRNMAYVWTMISGLVIAVVASFLR